MSKAGEGELSEEQQLLALREDIQRAATQSEVASGLLAAAVLLLLPLVLGACGCYAALHDPFYPTARLQNEGGLMIASRTTGPTIAGALLGLVLALPAAEGALALFHRAHRVRIREDLSGMSDEQRAAALAMLREFTGGAEARIVAPLIAYATPRGEVAPAAAPDARGDEASPAEMMP